MFGGRAEQQDLKQTMDAGLRLMQQIIFKVPCLYGRSLDGHISDSLAIADAHSLSNTSSMAEQVYRWC